jgi:hypothetical protein
LTGYFSKGQELLGPPDLTTGFYDCELSSGPVVQYNPSKGGGRLARLRGRVLALTLALSIPEQDWLEQAGRRDKNGAIGQDRTADRAEDLDAVQWQKILEEIEGFRKLGDNWDGLGASAPSDELLDSAIGLARLYWGRGMIPPIRVLPGTAGTVVFEWQDDVGDYGEVEIDRPFHAEAMLAQRGKPTRHWELPDA